jgi:hydrogenase maturation protease
VLVTGEVLVAGIGNLFLGDDGFGPEVVRHLAADPAGLPEGVRLVDYGIRGMHLAYDLLSGYEALVLVDAVPGPGAPGELTVLEIGPDDLGEGEFDAHGMAPASVLAALPSLGAELPPTYLIGCRPADWEEGIGLSDPVRAAVPVAAEAVRSLVERLVAERGALQGGG